MTSKGAVAKAAQVTVMLVGALSATARGQIAVLDAAGNPVQSGSAFELHRAACDQATQGALNDNNQFQLRWALSPGVVYQAFWSVDASCEAPGVDGGTNNNLAISVGSSNQITVNAETLLAQATGLTDPCDATPPASGTVYVCIAGSESDAYTTTGTLILTPFYLAVDYDMNPPPAPTEVTLAPADSELDCSWSFPFGAAVAPGDNADHFVVYAQEDSALVADAQGACSAPDGGTSGIVGGSVDPTGWPIQLTAPPPSSAQSSAVLASLADGHCYDVSVIAFYSDGTQGAPSAVVAAAPVASAAAEEGKSGGCQSAGGALFPLGFAAGLGLWWRRRKPQCRA